MHQLLQLRSTVQAASGHPCTVETFLGGGGQGEVYRAVLDGKPLALKWYFPEQATPAQRQNLETLIRKGPPNGQFLWPLELATSASAPGFGYLMPLREPRYKGIVDLMKGRIEPSFRALATAGLQLAQAFLELHAKGLCYRDISFGNVFFDPEVVSYAELLEAEPVDLVPIRIQGVEYRVPRRLVRAYQRGLIEPPLAP